MGLLIPRHPAVFYTDNITKCIFKANQKREVSVENHTIEKIRVTLVILIKSKELEMKLQKSRISW